MNILDSARFITPEIILFVSSIVILILSFPRKPAASPLGERESIIPRHCEPERKRGRSNLLGGLSLTAVIASSLYLPHSTAIGSNIFSNMLIGDPFSLCFKVLCLLATGIVVLLSMSYKALDENHAGEYYFLLLNAAIAMLLAISSNNFIMIYISLEMLSLVSYVLVAFSKRDPLSGEGAIKYFLFGALSTGIMLYGISLIYGLFNTTDLTLISKAVLTGSEVNVIGVTIALIFILAGLGFKCALVPFHMWAPDTYQGAPTAITAFISTGSKAVGFAVLLRIFSNIFFPFHVNWVHLAVAISIFTMTLGNIIAISQKDIKRMLAYSSIAQAGYILIGFVVGTSSGIEGVLYYLLAYTLMNLGAFGCVILVSNSIKTDAIKDYAGLYRTNPRLAFMLSVFLLSLAGVPPLAGFLGKFLVFAAAVESKFILLAIVGVVNSVIAAYYYLRVIKYMYLDEPKAGAIELKSERLQIVLVILMAAVLITGLFPAPFLNWIRSSQSIFIQ